MTLNGKRDDFTLDDFKACAKTVSMKRGRAETILRGVIDIVSRWPAYARNAEVPEAWQKRIQSTLRLQV